MHIVASDLGLSFNEVSVVEDFSATFEVGQPTAVVGPSGSGKSSLLALLSGLLEPTSGTVRFVDDEGVPSLPDQQRIAWITQEHAALQHRTVFDNVRIACLAQGATTRRAVKVEVDALLDQVGLSHRASFLAGKLSGGEVQRLAVARALGTNRPVLLGDEPTSNLDAGNTELIADLICGSGVERLVIVATHDPLVADRVQQLVSLR